MELYTLTVGNNPTLCKELTSNELVLLGTVQNVIRDLFADLNWGTLESLHDYLNNDNPHIREYNDVERRQVWMERDQQGHMLIISVCNFGSEGRITITDHGTASIEAYTMSGHSVLMLLAPNCKLVICDDKPSEHCWAGYPNRHSRDKHILGVLNGTEKPTYQTAVNDEIESRQPKRKPPVVSDEQAVNKPAPVKRLPRRPKQA